MALPLIKAPPALAAPDFFVTADGPIRAADAVAAILVLEDGRYIMQLRDTLPNIFYPAHWGCFGGAVNDEETPLDALVREVEEELEYRVVRAAEFTRFEFDLSHLGQPKVFRTFFEVRVPDEAFRRFVLHEGAAFEAIPGRELLAHRKVTPYDAFAIWMHLSRRRFEAAGKETPA
jgi:8-oxo-dGTP pyrophosphatase MutT (NUDIX family)